MKLPLRTLLLALIAGMLCAGPGLADPSTPASGDQGLLGGAGSDQDQAKAKMDQIHKLLEEAKKKEEPPGQPSAPPQPLPAAPPMFMDFSRGIPKADQVALIQSVARRVEQKQVQESHQAEQTALASAAVPAAPSTSGPGQHTQPVQPQPPVSYGHIHPTFGDAYDQLVLTNTTSTKAAKLAADQNHPEPGQELAGLVMSGGAPGKPATLAPAGTNFFTIPRHMNDASAVHPGSGRGFVPKPVPPPAIPALTDASAAPPVKGVRILFDSQTLQAAAVTDALLDSLTSRLSACSSPEELDRAVSWVDQQVTSCLLSGCQEQIARGLKAISLKSLLQKVQPYRQTWAQLPEELRHPGSLRRIFAYAIAGEDLFIIGSPDGPGRPLDIDDLIVGLSAGWRDGSTPMCSLDPEDAHQMGGRQRAVILGIDRHTHFAAVMLDTDYEMKKITLGLRQVHIAGFTDLGSLMLPAVEALKDGRPADTSLFNICARMWFVPVTPGTAEIRLSADGRLAVFNARVQVLTENMEVSGSALVGTGKTNPLTEQVSRGITTHYGEFEREVGLFGELHGLFDVMLLATLLRQQHADLPVLRQLCALEPLRTEVPDTYAGQSRVFEMQGLRMPLLAGGVQSKVDLPPAATVRVRDARMERVAMALSANPNTAAVASSVDGELGLSMGLGDSRPNRTVEVLQASNKVDAAGGWTIVPAADEMVEESPTAEAFRTRAMAYASQGLCHLADEDLWRAQLMEGQLQDRFLRMALPLLLPGDASAELRNLSAQDSAALADSVQKLAMQFAKWGRLATAAVLLDRSGAVMPANNELCITGAQIKSMIGDLKGAQEDLNKAIERSPRHAGLRLARAKIMASGKQWKEAITDLTVAIAADGRLVEALVLRASAVMQLDAQATDAALRDIKDALRVSGDNIAALTLEANLLCSEGDCDGAMAAADKAVAAGPGSAAGYFVRSVCRASRLMHYDSVAASWLQGQEKAMLEDLNTTLLIDSSHALALASRGSFLWDIANRTAEANDPWFGESENITMLVIAMSTYPQIGQRFMDGLSAIGATPTPDQVKAICALRIQCLAATAASDMEHAVALMPAQGAEPQRLRACQSQLAAMQRTMAQLERHPQ